MHIALPTGYQKSKPGECDRRGRGSLTHTNIVYYIYQANIII